ncbi:MAG: YeeE/YedE family protein [Chloroflexi bacterium]|uniref:rhodanese-like domain-containing protein n=1 Tax=Candidatus Flexifilum breve TaxID=3140694 RepID=UPI0031347778|nr:YeeE/YedE family protein [Chloroflexota bacterium]MBK9749498.1 YeeE/YedE family protein [Chloroflexota bacterium]
MAPFPLNLPQLLGSPQYFLVYLLIGFAFGAVLEMAGFAVSSKLAAQFYFKDLTVLKVMFTGIITAMVLVFLASGLGLLDYNLVYVNETYLVPGIVGGLIMGVGFILGGFCPGTSLVSAATLKIDGILFALGAFFGIFLFGETVGYFEEFWYSTYMGRITLMDFFGTDTGVIVLAVMIMALLAFVASEYAERVIGKQTQKQPRWRIGLAGGGIALAVVVLVIGQPTNADRWNRIAADKQPQLDSRAVYAHPAEVLHYMADHEIVTMLVDVRSESDYNLFHIRDARNVPYDQLSTIVEEFHALPQNAVVFVMSNDEAEATEAWKYLLAESVVNVYILDGGVNNWITVFGENAFPSADAALAADDQLDFQFAMAYGDNHVAASPHADRFDLTYEEHVVLSIKRGPASGGCG